MLKPLTKEELKEFDRLLRRKRFTTAELLYREYVLIRKLGNYQKLRHMWGVKLNSL